MAWTRATKLALAVAVVATIAGAVGLGVILRFSDPASSPVMVAEDPYTHMMLVRDHLRDGTLDPQRPGGALYPPGLHAFLAAWVSLGGGPLYEVMRFGPVLFGALGLVGLVLLLGGREGRVAAFAAVLAMAAMPEAIARTTMMSPTALDLALLPFFLLALLEIVRGRLAFLAMATPIALFFVVAHPWVLALMALAAVVWGLLTLAFPWSLARAPGVRREGVLAAAGLLGLTFGLAAATRWEASGTGFAELGAPLVQHLGGEGTVLAIAAAGAGAAAALAWLSSRARLQAWLAKPPPWWARLAGSAGLALVVALLTLPAIANGMPELVDLPRMIGWPLLALAVLGLLLAPVAGTPVAHLGAALFLAAYPFAIHNPLDSPYWPHRTVAFMALGVAVLTGVSAQRMAEAGSRLVAWATRRRAPAVAPGSRAAFALLAPGLLVAAAAAGVVVAGTPEPYPGGWYRLYNECEFDALQDVAARLNQEPAAVVILGSWQGRLVLAAFVDNTTRIWTSAEFFQDIDRERFLSSRALYSRPTYVLLERYLPQEVEGADWRFLDQAPWQKVSQACPGHGAMAHKSVLYRLAGSGSAP